jgi:hypothetical protein
VWLFFGDKDTRMRVSAFNPMGQGSQQPWCACFLGLITAYEGNTMEGAAHTLRPSAVKCLSWSCREKVLACVASLCGSGFCTLSPLVVLTPKVP